MTGRAAVVIGVGKTGQLVPLKSPVPGAKAVSKWLRGEGFEVKTIVDEKRPVTAKSIAKAIDSFIKPPTRYSMLLVYFSGHGLLQARSDLWLLSGAPQQTDEAINLAGAIDLARGAGIPNIVLVSDACRSLPQDLGGAFVKGVDAFPFYNGLKRSKVDVFRATLPAKVAYEAEIKLLKQKGGDKIKDQSVLTLAWLSAYDDPPEAMRKKLKIAGEELIVVPNRALEDYLQDKIDRLLGDIDINLEQTIEADVPSDDDIYIGRARIRSAVPPVVLPGDSYKFEKIATTAGDISKIPARSKVKPKPRRKTAGRLAAQIVRETLAQGLPERGVLESGALPKRMQRSLGSQIAARLPTDVVTHFETETGFAIYGAGVRRVAPIQGQRQAWAELLDPGAARGRPALFRVWDVNAGASVAVEFADGRSSVFAAIRGYIGHCTVTSAGLSNVSYVPSNNTNRWWDYVGRRDLVDKLRAEVAVAADHNTFSLASKEKARQFAELVRLEKRIDPTLGLYAAYAYTQADDETQVRSVLQFMRADIDADLFDLRMLAFRQPPAAGSRDATLPIVPACPMLTQGWNLLGSRRIDLPAVFAEGARHLTGSLWTTFERPFTERLFATFEQGTL